MKWFSWKVIGICLLAFYGTALVGCTDYGGTSHTGSGNICIVSGDAQDDREGNSVDCSTLNDNSSEVVNEVPVEE